MRTRIMLGAVGVVMGGYGAFLLLTRQDPDQLTSAAIWLAGGVVLHDLVVSPLLLLAVVLGARVLPARARAPAAVGLVVLGTVTAFTIPVLTDLGDKVDGDGLLDRSYVLSWLLVAGLVLLAVIIGSFAGSRRRTVQE